MKRTGETIGSLFLDIVATSHQSNLKMPLANHMVKLLVHPLLDRSSKDLSSHLPTSLSLSTRLSLQTKLKFQDKCDQLMCSSQVMTQLTSNKLM